MIPKQAKGGGFCKGAGNYTVLCHPGDFLASSQAPKETVTCMNVHWTWHQHFMQYCAVKYSAVWYNAVQCSAMQCCAVQYSVEQLSAIKYMTTQFSKILFSTVQWWGMSVLTMEPSNDVASCFDPLHTVHCTLCTVHCTLHTIHCTL